MRIPSNSIGHIIAFFRDELKGLYDDVEINSLMYLTLEHYTKLSKTQLLVQKENRVSESVLLKIKFAINDLKLYRPIQYILGKADFFNLKFIVNESVLVPRPETEELVNWVLTDNTGSDFVNLLDIGTGSGCIAIVISNIMKNWKIKGIDVSEKAINVAVENNYNNSTSVEFLVFDILNKQIWDKLSNFDIIVSNPPYIPENEKHIIPKNVIDFEPHIALFVPDQYPFVFYETIVDFASKKLRKNGQLFFEIHEKNSNELLSLLKRKNFSDIQMRYDINNKPRLVKLVK